MSKLTIPPPSIEIGIINSLGDFFIGCLSPDELIVDDDWMNDCVGVVSESFDSFVDWRDNVFLYLCTWGWEIRKIYIWKICVR